MNINHIDLQVSDVPDTIIFFERLFGLTCQSNPNSKSIAILSDQAGFVLVLQRKKRPEESYPEGFHLGFIVDDIETVERIHARAKEEGIEVSDLIRNNRGTILYCKTPDGYAVEVSCRRA